MVKRSLSRFGSGLPIVYQKPSRNVNTMFRKFLDFFGASEPGICSTPRLRRDKLHG